MTASVTVTDRAAERTAQTVSNEPENSMLRVSVEGSGCSGETRTAGNRMTFDTIRSDFAFLDDWEDRYRYVIELGRGLPPLPETYRTDRYKVRGCASQVWLATETERQARRHSARTGSPLWSSVSAPTPATP
jgi:hypothetical protein